MFHYLMELPIVMNEWDKFVKVSSCYIDGILVLQNQAEWIHKWIMFKDLYLKNQKWDELHRNIIDFSERTTYKNKMVIMMRLTKIEMVCCVPGCVEEFDTR